MPPGRDRVLSINLKPGHDVSASKGSFCFTDEKKVWLKCIYNAMPYHEHMDADIIRLAEAIVAGYHRTPVDRRLLIAIAGPPGSGKSTLAYPLTAHLNSVLRNHRPEPPSSVDEQTGLASRPECLNQKSDIAVCVGLDGWHYSRKELDRFEDPVEAHWRRGAAFTFNLPSYLSFLQQLRLPLVPDPPTGIPFPTFDHALKDPLPSPDSILPSHRVIIVEGLYTMLDKPGWRECAEMMDIRVWVETDREICRRRVIARNFAAGVVDDLQKCEERVDASDMVNGDEVRQFRYQPDFTITIEDKP